MKQVLECCLLSLSLFLFFSCGKEEEGPIPTDRQVPIGVMEASLSTRAVSYTHLTLPTILLV